MHQHPGTVVEHMCCSWIFTKKMVTVVLDEDEQFRVQLRFIVLRHCLSGRLNIKINFDYELFTPLKWSLETILPNLQQMKQIYH